MKKISLTAISIFLIFLVSCSKDDGVIEGSPKPSNTAISGTFYIDDINGNDNNDGKSSGSPWKTITKVNEQIFAPGSQILFKAGGVWNGKMLQFKGSGTSGSPIIISKYGEGKLPQFNAAGIFKAAIYLYNQQYIEIKEVEATNYNPQEDGGISLQAWEAKNISDYAAVATPPQAVKNNSFKFGIYVEAKDTGAVKHIYLQKVLVHGVNGAINQDNEDTKDNGGVAFVVTGSGKKTWFEDILIEECTIRDVDRTGLYTSSSWGTRTLTSNSNWTPTTNLIIRNNIFKKSGANALIVRVSDTPLIERNLFDSCAIKGSGNAAFCFNTDNATFQYNEARFTKANVDDRDAGGLDSDYRTKNTFIQYNWLHDNDFGMLVTGGGGVFNDNTVVRYNIIERDGLLPHPDHGKFIFKVSGAATNTKIYNNTVYIAPSQSATALIRHANWTVWPSTTNYSNNIFYNEGSGSIVNTGSSTGNSYNNNMVVVNNVAISNNVAAGTTSFVNINAGPNGYKLKTGSAALAGGISIPNNGGKDYFNASLPSASPNIGAYEGPGL